MEFRIIQGDIAKQKADALVNAAGTSLSMGSGVAGSLLQAAKGPLEDDAVAKGPVQRGDVVVTAAYDLDAEYVIHAAAMSHSGPNRLATDQSIQEATDNSLQAADYLECKTLVLPLLGCGAGGYPTPDGARLICEEIDAFDPSTLVDVRVIGYTDREIDILEEVTAKL